MSNNSGDNEINPVVGIDLGTTFSCIARWDGREPEIYPGLDKIEHHSEMPSVVYIDENEAIIVGKVAHSRYLNDPENGITKIKREMGNREFRVNLRGKEYSPVDISSLILKKIKDEICGRYPASVNFRILGTVITHPFHFKTPQIADTREAGEKAGLNVIGLVPEPVAASIAYAFHSPDRFFSKENSEVVLVFDLGGGTFDTTLFEIRKTSEELLFKALATGGDARLGGTDFNESFLNYIIQVENLSLGKLAASEKIRAEAFINQALEQSKRALSALDVKSWSLAIPHVIPGKNIDRKITRDIFERVLRGEFGGKNYYDYIKNIVQDTIYNGKKEAVKVKKVLMVGGSSRIPLMREMLSEMLPNAEFCQYISESLVVAQGASIYAALLDNRLQYVPKDHWLRNEKGDPIRVVIEIPTAHALGIRADNDRFVKIISENTPTPCTKSRTFVTPEDDTSKLDIEIFQGRGDKITHESLRKEKVSQIGTIEIPNLPKHKKGEVRIRVSFIVGMNQMISIKVETFYQGKAIYEKVEALNLK